MKISKKIGRPKKSVKERGEVVPIRLNEYYRKEISKIQEKSLAANVRYLLDEYLVWIKAKKEIQKAIEEKSKFFIQSLSIFIEVSKTRKKVEADGIKENLLKVSVELKFLSDLLCDSHQFLQQVQGGLYFKNLQDVWKIAKI